MNSKKIEAQRPPRRPDGIRTRFAVVIALLSAGAGALLFLFPWHTWLERKFSDHVARLRAENTSPAPQVVVVAIDEPSLHALGPKLGRFPWPRVWYSILVEHAAGASAIGFDMLLPEDEPQGGRDPEPLYEAMREQGRVVSACHLLTQPKEDGPLSVLVPYSVPAQGRPPAGQEAYQAVDMPIPHVLGASRGLGHTNAVFDPDGLIRRYPLWSRAGDRWVPSLALSSVAVHLGVEPAALAPGQPHPALPPLDDSGSFHFLPVADGYAVYPFVDVVTSWNEATKGRTPLIPSEAFRDKIVLIGSTGTGLPRDRVNTVAGPSIPGVIVHAMAINAMLNRAWIIPGWPGWSVLAALGGSLLLALAYGRQPARLTILAAVLIGLVLAGGALASVPVVPPVAALGLCYLGLMLHNWRFEREEVRRLENLEQYKQRFTDMLVHDIKGKLASLDLAVSSLPADPDPSGGVTGLLRASSRSLLSQVNALLDIRRMEEGRMELNRQPVDVTRELERLAQEYRSAAAALDLTLVLRPEDNLRGTLVDADPAIFARMVENYLWNALQNARRRGDILLSGRRRGDHVDIFVENDCAVIPPDQIAGLFEPYVTRGRAERRGAGTNAGLGLAFCRMAARAHGGEVKLESPRPGHPTGVRATLTLPVLRDLGKT